MKIESTTPNPTQSEFHRFQVFHGTKNENNNVTKSRTVGMAYLRSGQDMYTLRLWTFLNEKFFLLPSKKEAGRYLVMTREPTKNPNSKTKYFWNIVGNARVDSSAMCLEIEFDLFEKRVYMNLFPEAQTVAKNLPEPVSFGTFEVAA